MGKKDKEQGNPEIRKLKKLIANLVKKNIELEDKFDKVANFSVRVDHHPFPHAK